MGAGLLMICAFFIVGGLLEKVVHIPGPVLMILAAVFCKYTNVIPAAMELGAHSCYKFVSADDRPGHAVCAAGERGLGLLHWLRRGLRLHRYCHGAERFLYRYSPEYVSGGSRYRDQLP